MASLLLVVFVLQLAIHFINTIGASTINEILWMMYNRLPLSTAKAAKEQNRLRREVVRLKREMNSISAQDEFSRWAKLQRQHNKAEAEYNKISSSVSGTKTTFDTTVNTLRWITTQGLRFYLQFMYSRQPMFWIPNDWVPYYVEWTLALPRAPTGSVSIQIWGIACASVIAMLSEAVLASWTLIHRKEGGNTAPGKPKVPQDAGGMSGKKEL